MVCKFYAFYQNCLKNKARFFIAYNTSSNLAIVKRLYSAGFIISFFVSADQFSLYVFPNYAYSTNVKLANSSGRSVFSSFSRLKMSLKGGQLYLVKSGKRYFFSTECVSRRIGGLPVLRFDL